MKRRGVFLAAALVLAADAIVLMKTAQNRAGAPATAIELTERELRLRRPHRESTALFLELTWGPARRGFKFEDGPGWFNQAKLEELGYDCRLPLTDQSASEHYRRMPAKKAFAVLEYKEAAPADDLTFSRLVAVDAGRELTALRKKYPDTRRFLIVPSLVRLFYQANWDPNTRRNLPGAYLGGRVVQALVREVSVPPSQRGVFETFGQSSYEYFASPEGRAGGPRYSAVLYYGKNHEPWIGVCRRLSIQSGAAAP